MAGGAALLVCWIWRYWHYGRGGWAASGEPGLTFTGDGRWFWRIGEILTWSWRTQNLGFRSPRDQDLELLFAFYMTTWYTDASNETVRVTWPLNKRVNFNGVHSTRQLFFFYSTLGVAGSTEDSLAFGLLLLYFTYYFRISHDTPLWKSLERKFSPRWIVDALNHHASVGMIWSWKTASIQCSLALNLRKQWRSAQPWILFQLAYTWVGKWLAEYCIGFLVF